MTGARNRWWPVARWELTRMLKRKDFVLSLLLTPAIAFASLGLASFANRLGEGKGRRVAVVWAGPSAGDTLAALTGYRWSYPRGPEATEPALRSALAAKRLDAVVRLPSGWERGVPVEVLLRRDLPGATHAIEGLLRARARPARAAQHGLDSAALAALDDSVRLRATLTVRGVGGSRGDRLAALVLMLVMLVTIFTTYSYLMIGIAGEKQVRFTEVVISAIPPQAWIDGKLVAYTLLGLLQVAVYVLTAAAFAARVSFAMPVAVTPAMAAGCLLVAALGLAFYNATIAMVMATLKDLQSSSTLQGSLVMLPFLPVAFLGPVLNLPDAPWVVALSLLPPCTPILLPARMALGGVPVWEFALGVVLLAASAWLMRGAAGHAFRIGMLMYGKDLTLPELWRWSRERVPRG